METGRCNRTDAFTFLVRTEPVLNRFNYFSAEYRQWLPEKLEMWMMLKRKHRYTFERRTQPAFPL